MNEWKDEENRDLYEESKNLPYDVSYLGKKIQMIVY